MTEIARVRWVGVDTHGVYRANKKAGRAAGLHASLRLPVFLHVRSKVRCFELSVRPLFRGLRVYLSRLIHRFATADVLAFESWVVDHPLTSLRCMISAALRYDVSAAISRVALASGGPRGAGKVLADGPELPPPRGLHTVRQDHLGHLIDLGDPDFGNATVGGQRLGSLAPDQVGPVSVYLKADIELGERAQDPGRHDHMRKPDDRFGNPSPDLGILLGEALAEFRRMGFPFLSPLDDLDALPDVLDAFDIDREAESIQKLRAEIAFFRVHGADQDEARRMPDRNPFAFNDVHAHGRSIEQHVNQVIVEQVDLIDVEDVAVRFSENARLEAALAALDRRLDVDRADDAILRGVDGQLDDAHAAAGAGQCLSARQAVLAIRAERLGRVRITTVEAVRDDGQLGQQTGEGSHRGRLARAFLTANEHAADRRVDRIQDESELHLVLADDGAERVDESFHQAEPVLSISRWTLSTIELCERSNNP